MGAPHPQKPATTERRSSERHLTICRIARVRGPNDIGLWRIRNISDDGIMFAAEAATSVGDELEIWLSDSISLRGEVVWIKNGLCGVAFYDKIDAAGTLQALASEQVAERHRALRLPIEADAIITLRDNSYPIDLVDISHRGAGFRFAVMLEPGTELNLLLPGGELTRRAVVRWSEGNRGGLWFVQPLGSSDLESMARFRENMTQ
ncbi:PilZ domain-containing protein [Sphingopyxis macrogoltabida]|uniref:PilZ domain-containing protein n=1 Tax=Sphingopyxis macrogoltabida TaxID=33050 RepID=UPI001F3C815A|nr:PilZ domain-containing protein [Sphingopyxis macrogoltabida]